MTPFSSFCEKENLLDFQIALLPCGREWRKQSDELCDHRARFGSATTFPKAGQTQRVKVWDKVQESSTYPQKGKRQRVWWWWWWNVLVSTNREFIPSALPSGLWVSSLARCGFVGRGTKILKLSIGLLFSNLQTGRVLRHLYWGSGLTDWYCVPTSAPLVP